MKEIDDCYQSVSLQPMNLHNGVVWSAQINHEGDKKGGWGTYTTNAIKPINHFMIEGTYYKNIRFRYAAGPKGIFDLWNEWVRGETYITITAS